MPPHWLLAIRIPAVSLIALDSRLLHFWMQPLHYLIRIVHIVSMAAFFGGILLVDLRLIGRRERISLRELTGQVIPAVYVSFVAAMVSGVVLFCYDPVHVGAHAYFVPKLTLIGLGMLNALVFHRTTYVAALGASGAMPVSARAAGVVSLLIWSGVLICACLNTEGAPRVFLR